MEMYNHKEIEKKWQKKWEKDRLYKSQDFSDKPKFYCLDMFPYPSGAGLHVGHPEGYTATDIVSRYKRMNGYNVLHPMGWDAFGLPAENYAIKTKVHPDKSTHENINRFREQIQSLGLSYDWEREVDTSSPEYYKWTQWFFLFLYKNGWAYRKKAPVNWCPSCQTVLANEQVIDGACDRCKTKVIQKELKQWFFKITDFAEELIAGLDKIDWPESTKIMQRHWIGKSEGAEIKFSIFNFQFSISVFTTRPDTIFGATYLVLAPEHKIVEKLKDKIENYAEIEKYVLASKKKTERERLAQEKEKTGVELKGIKAINPANNQEIPIFIADYVLKGYGTGAIMAVPKHDLRDYLFAQKYNLPIVEVIKLCEIKNEKLKIKNHNLKFKNNREEELVYEDEGVLVNSGEFNGLDSEAAREKITEWLATKGLAKKKINYKLRDWLISRQRYWGAPIPIFYCEKCGEVPVSEEDLPVLLPRDVDFMPHGESPLTRSKEFHKVKCPKCGGKARRESDTMDTFVCSSWYFFRYCDPKNAEEFASKKLLKYWMPVDLYVGGAEHTVLHLLYSRFFTKALHKKGLINFDEPFLKLRHQGMILAEDGRKMSKSLGNVINPDEVVEKYGADTMRMYEMFMGPFEDSIAWNTKGVIGVRRFLEKVWKIKSGIRNQESGTRNNKLDGLVHRIIKKVGVDIENFKFNTAVASLMILVNHMEREEFIPQHLFESFLKILSPFAPHLAEELWTQLGYKVGDAEGSGTADEGSKSIFVEKWPEYDLRLVQEDEVDLVIQVNGKVRAVVQVKTDISESEAKKIALKQEKIKKWIGGKKVRKFIFVPGRLINIVI
ncbi:MAG: leucine--tRNA ligase [Patescibacteria group bacterium]|nr:leucine--tRNA ligase [Patescibacteria group bacterium]